MKYNSKRDKTINYIQNNVMNKLKSLDSFTGLPYDDLVNELTLETGSTTKQVEEIIRIFIRTNKLREERFIYPGENAKKLFEQERLELNNIADQIVKSAAGLDQINITKEQEGASPLPSYSQ